MRILVTGGSGLLGCYLDRVMDAEYTWYSAKQPWTRHQMAVNDEAQVARVFTKVRPTHVLHMASVGDVDWCERNYIEAEKIIVGGTRNVLDAAREYGAKFVYVSSNAVFGGDDPPYGPDDERRPVNRYGAFRRRAEDLVMDHDGGWAVVRLFLLYGWEPMGARGNWASRLFEALFLGQEPRLVDDRWWQPSYAHYVAMALKDMLDKVGAWHVMGADRVTLFRFGEEVADVFGHGSGKVKAIPSGDLLGAAPRPVDTTYSLGAENTVILPGIEAGLTDMLNELRGKGCGT